MRFAQALIIGLAVLNCGCDMPEGVAPFEDIIPYPTDIALYPSEKYGSSPHPAIPYAEYAYVVASNFDIAYNSGAVKVIDLSLLDELMKEDAESDAPIYAKRFPPEIPTPFTEAVVKDAGVFISNFGGEIKMLENPADKEKILLVSVRENNTVTPIRILESGGKLNCFLGEKKRDCGREQSIETGRDDPFGMIILTIPTLKNPSGTTFLFTSHLRKGEVVFWALDEFLEKKDKTRLEAGSSVVLSRTYGAAEFAYAAESGLVYLNSRTRDLGAFNVISVFDPIRAVTTGERSYVDEYVDVSAVIGGEELRGFAVSPDGRRLYVASRAPDAVFILDVSLRPDGTGPRNRITAIRPVDLNPSRIAYIDLDGENDLIAVTCTGGDSLYLLDARTLDIVQIIQNIGDGPFAIAVYKRPSIPANGVDLYIMVSNFEESTLVALRLDPDSRQAIPVARIGAVRSRLEDFK
ncbi:MAG: hypothetical protein Kow0090_01680 [Myxococcota bacterium]